MLRVARYGLVAAVAALSACAVPHGRILPMPIPPQAYDGATCRQLSLMHAKSMRTLIFSGIAQDHIYEADQTRTFGIPTPMGTIFETSRAEEVSRLKGETAAISQELARAGCIAWPG